MKFFLSILCIFMIMNNYWKRRLISSSSLWVVCYFMIFVLYPLFSEKYYENARLIDFCAIIGIIFYTLGALLGEKLEIGERKNQKKLIPDFNISYIGFWVVLALFFASIVMKIGTSGLRAVLQGNITANQLAWSDELSMDNIYIYLLNMLIPFVIAVWIQANSNKKGDRLKAFFCMGIFLVVSLIFSYTRLFIICTFVIILFYEMRHKSPRKQMMIGVVAVTVLTLLMIFLNFYRNLGSSNMGDFWSYINVGYVFESTDFGASYKWFNELLNYESPYIFPITYLKPLFAFIPRSIWASKPEPLSLDILKMIDPALAKTGYSTAGNSVLGEGFAIMGWLGIAIFPLIWGVVCTYFDRKYQYKILKGEEKSLWIISYYIFAAFIIVSCQRGDWSQYGTIIVWLFLLPLVLISKFKTRRIRITLKSHRM